MKGLLLLVGWLVLLFGTLLLARRVLQSERARKRLFVTVEPEDPHPLPDSEQRGMISRWLFLAGYRSPSAAPLFVILTLVLLAVGLCAAFLIEHSGLIDRGMRAIDAVPGGALDIFVPVLYGAPWLALGFLGALPWFVVRSARKERVTVIEQDLPITLEILSTLAEAGLSFDPALDRLLESQPPRPLAVELRTFRDETRSGRSRVESFRRLARRMEVTSVSTFVSALVQAEQSGAGIATVLRQQADDMRNRRRERALEAASALPVKRLVPLFVCFLPGIFVWALGPSFYQIIRFLDVFARNRGLR